MAETPEQWLERYLEPETGFPPFTGTVQSSIFTTDARFQNGQQMLLVWKMVTSEGEDREQFWGVGKLASGWFSPDGGQTVQNREGKKLHSASAYMRGVLVPCAGWDLGAQIDAAGGPLTAAAWDGTSWDLGDVQHDFGGEIGTRNVRTLLAYHGGFGGTTGLATPTAPTIPTDKFNAVLATLTQTERAFLEEQAKGDGNLSDWAITNMPAKMSDPAFMAAIVDPAFKDALLAVV